MTVVTPGPRDEERDMEGVRVLQFGCRAGRVGHIAHGIGGIVSNLRERPWRVVELPGLLGGLRRGLIMQRKQLEVVHAHWLYPAGRIAVAAPYIDIPVVVTSHGTDMALARWPPIAMICRTVVRRADYVVGVNRQITDQLREFGAQPSRSAHLSVGVEVPAVVKPPVASGELRVLYVGALRQSKSVSTLLNSLSDTKLGDQCLVSVVGDGPMMESCRRLARRLNLRNVTFHGARSPTDVGRFLESADVLVHPSTSEGTPAVVLEAMAVGLPVIASDIDAHRELITHGSNGLLFPTEDASRLADLLEHSYQNRDHLRELGAEGRAMAQRHDIQRIARRYLEIYEKAMSS